MSPPRPSFRPNNGETAYLFRGQPDELPGPFKNIDEARSMAYEQCRSMDCLDDKEAHVEASGDHRRHGADRSHTI